MAARRALGTVVAVAIIAVAVGGWLGWRHITRFHEHVSGARGSFPAALGQGAPAAPDRLVRRTSSSYGVDGGLSIDSASDGIIARNLRTGKEYWHYGRDHTQLGQVGLTSDGDTIATWWQDGVVVATDVRTGKPRWHAKATYGRPDNASDRDFATIRVIGDQVVTESRTQITAFGKADGKRQWSGAIPHGCSLDSGAVFAMRNAIAAPARCAGDAAQLVGFDDRRGTVRWRVPVEEDQLVRADNHTLITSTWKRIGVGATVDVSGSKPVITTRPVPDDHLTIAAGAGIALSVDTSAKAPDGTLAASGVTDGQPRWTRQPAKDTRFGFPLLAGGRVYVVQQPLMSAHEKPNPGRSDLLVLDARTGRQLDAMRLPSLPQDLASQYSGSAAGLTPWQAADGVVAIRWDGVFTGPTADLLVVTT